MKRDYLLPPPSLAIALLCCFKDITLFTLLFADLLRNSRAAAKPKGLGILFQHFLNKEFPT